jgi:hypothetical protein
MNHQTVQMYVACAVNSTLRHQIIINIFSIKTPAKTRNQMIAANFIITPHTVFACGRLIAGMLHNTVRQHNYLNFDFVM